MNSVAPRILLPGKIVARRTIRHNEAHAGEQMGRARSKDLEEQKPRFSVFPYVPFLFFACFLAIVGMFAFEYFAHGKTSMDPRSRQV